MINSHTIIDGVWNTAVNFFVLLGAEPIDADWYTTLLVSGTLLTLGAASIAALVDGGPPRPPGPPRMQKVRVRK